MSTTPLSAKFLFFRLVEINEIERNHRNPFYVFCCSQFPRCSDRAVTDRWSLTCWKIYAPLFTFPGITSAKRYILYANVCVFSVGTPLCVTSVLIKWVALFLSWSTSGWGGPGDVHHKSRGSASGRGSGWKDSVCHSQGRISLWRDQVNMFTIVEWAGEW